MANYKKPKMANNSFDLPEELLYEIFSYLPSKSVGKSRCLSKTWNTQLSTSQFIELHQSREKTESLVILSESDGYLHSVSEPIEKADVVWSPTPIMPGFKWLKLFGSSNGLLLLFRRKRRSLFVINPITRKQVAIQTPPCIIRKDYFVQCGFGYDRVSNDYKVVVLSCEGGIDWDVNVGVYCMKTRVWRTIDYRFSDCIHYKRNLSLVNAALHWFTDKAYTECSGRICALDLATETISEIPLPKGVSCSLDGLVVLRGCLANVEVLEFGSVDIWVMNEYGVGDSWVQYHIPENKIWSRVLPLHFVGEEEMLCVTGVKMQCWAVFDLKKRVWSRLVRSGENPVCFTDWTVFEEGLISPE